MKTNSVISSEQVKIITETGKLIYAAIAELDQRGTDEKVSAALSIVYEIVDALSEGQHLTPAEAHTRAMKRIALQREQE